MEKGQLLIRHKLKVIVNGKLYKCHKSDSLDYIMETIEGYKKEFGPEEIRFDRNRSEVMIIQKPNKIFKNIPDWKNVNYGINSDIIPGYYLRNNDSGKIIRIYEKKL